MKRRRVSYGKRTRRSKMRGLARRQERFVKALVGQGWAR